MSERSAAPRAVTAAGFISFLGVGAVVASYGPSIPHVVARFGVSSSAGGLIVAAHFFGSLVGMAIFGLAPVRWAVQRRLVSSAMVFSAGALAAAAAPSWPILLVTLFLLGSGAGGLVVLINLHFATRFGRRSPAMLALVNAAYGVGSILGPALVGVAGGYSPLLVAAGVASAVCILPLSRIPAATATAAAPSSIESARARSLVAWFAVLLLVYVGIESGVGTWEATDLIASGFSAQFAAAATSLYWAAFTLGRVIAAPFAMRLSSPQLLIASLGMTTLMLGLLAVHVYPPLTFALVGLFAGPIFPVVLSWLARVVPNAKNAITYAILGTVCGYSVLPAALGGMIGLAGLGSLPIGMAACSITAAALVVVIASRLGEPIGARRASRAE
jgi:FHS family glucose/mannose:H+ symporter-like MFS transporter